MKCIYLCALLFLPSCMIGPKYRKPDIKVPNSYSEQPCTAVTAELAHWWTFFEDSELNNLIKKAIGGNFDLRIAMEKIEEARALYRIQEANLFPEIDLDAQYLREKNSETLNQLNSIIQNPVNFMQINFAASWELDFWGKLRRASKAAYDLYQAQIEHMRDVYIILLADVAKTYIDMRAFQKKAALLEQQVAVDSKLLCLSRVRFTAGIASDIPDMEQLAALEESKSELLLVQAQLKASRIRLAILLGENPEGFNPGNNLKPYVPRSKKELKAGLPSDLIRRRPDIRQAERTLAAATENVGIAIAQWFPSFTLLGNFGWETNTIDSLFSGSSIAWSFGPSMSWPIITFGRIRFNIDAKKSARRQALLAYAQSIVSALGDVETALVNYFNERERLQTLQIKVGATTRERNLFMARFASGLDNQTLFLIAEKNRLQAELSATDSEQALSSYLIVAYKALGGGWEYV